MINQFTFSFLDSGSNQLQNKTLAPSTFGINMPQYPPTGSLDFSVGGNFDLGSGYTTRFFSHNYQFKDTMDEMLRTLRTATPAPGEERVPLSPMRRGLPRGSYFASTRAPPTASNWMRIATTSPRRGRPRGFGQSLWMLREIPPRRLSGSKRRSGRSTPCRRHPGCGTDRSPYRLHSTATRR